MSDLTGQRSTGGTLTGVLSEVHPAYNIDETLTKQGYAADAKAVGEAVGEAIGEIESHTTNKDNPHGVTKEQIGLSNVDNTSDMDKPVSNAQAVAIASARNIAANAQAVANTKLSETLLWQNSKPTSEFAAQSIALDLSPFDYITIEYAPIATSYLKTAFCKVGGGCLLDAVSGSGNASSGESGMGGSHVYSVWRNTICTDATKVTFTKAVRQSQDSASVGITDSNFYVIPVRIYGIKGVQT